MGPKALGDEVELHRFDAGGRWFDVLYGCKIVLEACQQCACRTALEYLSDEATTRSEHILGEVQGGFEERDGA